MANGDVGDVADNLMPSLKSFLTEKVTQIENNVKDTIVSELGKNMKEITELNAGVPSPVNQDSPDGQTKKAELRCKSATTPEIRDARRPK